ncbi:MAG: tRNA 4-thiouridine(8) synthase ThiI [Clostridia bacterium]|nr:tRNA 4-thiouridine(8) synthase ThiI [Clostridia bacterium]
MEKVILCRYGEIHLKGANRGYFEHALLNNIKQVLKDYKLTIKRVAGRYEVSEFGEEQTEEIVQKLKKVFGLHSLSVASKFKTCEEAILNICSTIKLSEKTFKVEVRRADKRFPIKSMEMAGLCGEQILNNNKNIRVDVHNPEVVVKIDIREDGNTYLSFLDILCAGGMPVGTAGKGLLLLSGGIDSPVAGYFLAKRGMTVHGLHFHSYPYTSLQAKDKVIRLAKIMNDYCLNMKLHILSFTKVQEEINKNCNRDYMIILMRRIMMRVAEKLSQKIGANAIITGESLAQVASQTIESITATNSVVKMPVFRPLIGFDKLDTIKIAKDINTYETSIEPYEDCCTIFLPKNPVTRPQIEKVLEEEAKLDIEALVKDCLESDEVINI